MTSSPNPPDVLKHYVVPVEIVDRYWSVDLLVDDETPEAAIKQAQRRFDQAVSLGYITGVFRATQATPVELTYEKAAE